MRKVGKEEDEMRRNLPFKAEQEGASRYRDVGSNIRRTVVASR